MVILKTILINVCGHSEDEIKENIITKYNLTLNEKIL